MRELSHRRTAGRHLRFRVREESLVELFYLRIPARGQYRWHVEQTPDIEMPRLRHLRVAADRGSRLPLAWN